MNNANIESYINHISLLYISLFYADDYVGLHFRASESFYSDYSQL